MTPREFVAGLLGAIGALLFHAMFTPQLVCRRACCVEAAAAERRKERWRRGETEP